MSRSDFFKTYEEYAKAHWEKPSPWDVLKLDERRDFSTANSKDRNDIEVAKEHAPKVFLAEVVDSAGEELLNGSAWARRVRFLICKLAQWRLIYSRDWLRSGLESVQRRRTFLSLQNRIHRTKPTVLS